MVVIICFVSRSVKILTLRNFSLLENHLLNLSIDFFSVCEFFWQEKSKLLRVNI